MPAKQKKTRPVPNQNQYLIAPFIGNFIGLLIVTPIMVEVVFKNFGNGKGDMFTVQLFIFFFIACFTVIQTHGAIINTRKDFFRGKWVMVSNKLSHDSDSFKNPWHRIGLFAVVAGLSVALIASLIAPYLGKAPYSRLTINIMAFIPLILVSTVLIRAILPGDLVSFTDAFLRPASPRKSFISYYLLEFFLPWAIIQSFINFPIGLKQFSNEMLKQKAIEIGGVPLMFVAADFGVVFLILIFFMWLTADGQVRTDVRLNRLPENEPGAIGKFVEKGGLPIIALLVSFILLSGLIGLCLGCVLHLTNTAGVSVIAASILKTVAAILGCFAGCGIGIWWGSRREMALIREENVASLQELI